MFKKILIANRGEIAVRVIRACREMGIIPVAVYSDVDRSALHVKLAQEAYHIGPATPSESYLTIDKIIDAAKNCRAEALHPGYGFLAENAKLVQKCEQEGIVFIGPPSDPMDVMGTKTTSRKKMAEAGIPIIPGTVEPIKSEKELARTAEEIGFPVLLESGGRGRRKGTAVGEAEGRIAFGL